MATRLWPAILFVSAPSPKAAFDAESSFPASVLFTLKTSGSLSLVPMKSDPGLRLLLPVRFHPLEPAVSSFQATPLWHQNVVVVRSYTSKPFAGFFIAARCVEVILGTRIPFVVLFISSIELESGDDPSP